MKSLFLGWGLALLFFFLSYNYNNQFAAFSNAKSRVPSGSSFKVQVQHCPGTETLGNEGQGTGASAFVNVFNKSCELAAAFGYEYGNDSGPKFGQMMPYSLTYLNLGETVCKLTESNGELYISVYKTSILDLEQVLVENCKVEAKGINNGY